ncbi:helix-turn-helix domain-containing protein [Geoalkalibacter halelectricus]|uniref:Cupin domain-containing protein n=1 Tax=Geoalkalibacter halelectricus TaxID=2847045 RepID=A0ABY5ZQP0_9BACT|nr:cupin domain-containing protein [Geoalkalibacter halelectricus]MDO3377617.1 cupin domain-containing protein [Geoalkalibacter halelectricus]UWZ81408.1 cupin domain-containing protein [Geoalkalibacter halelectricus]
MDNIRDEVKELQIGIKVRRLRQEKRLTLQALSDATGLSKPLLSQIENDQVIPPLATLLRISKALKVGIHSFFEEEGDGEKCILVRADQRRPLQRRHLPDHPVAAYTYHSLAYGRKNKHMEPFLVEFQRGEWHEELMVRHEGEEFLFLLSGELELHYGDQVMILKPGDSVYYDSSEPHGYIARSPLRTQAVAVLYSKE